MTIEPGKSRVRLLNPHPHEGRTGVVFKRLPQPGKTEQFRVVLEKIPGDSTQLHVHAVVPQMMPIDSAGRDLLPMAPKVVAWPEDE